MAFAVAGDPATIVRDSWEYNLRKYILLLATMVGTITYTAGFTPPGGVWDAAAGHLPGDPIIRETSHRRYLAFFYTNAAAFASSLVVIVLVLILASLHEKKNKSMAPLGILRFVMVLDLFSLMAAYAAGTCRDTLTKVYSSVLVLLAAVYAVVQMAMAVRTDDDKKQHQELRKSLQKQRKMLMVLATFAVSVTYLAGLSAPGGFWNSSEGGNQPGMPVLKGRQDARLGAFFVFNTTAFVASLLVIVRLLDSKLRMKPVQKNRIPLRLYVFVISVLIGLMGAYATGSCRKVDTSIKVSVLVVSAVLGFIVAVLLLIVTCSGKPSSSVGDGQQQPRAPTKDDEKSTRSQEKARSLVLLLATLAATIAYQAGLDPPGGLREEDGDGYLAGDPILLSTNPKRYNAFFYCNSVAFVASLVAVILAKFRVPVKYHALEAAMMLDLFGLIGAYAAGASRDVTTSVYAIALAGAVLVYVVIHVAFFTLDHEEDNNNRGGDYELLEKRRKRLLLFAILAATICYQAGLTPPSGFDMSGHHAGDPALLYNHPHRYKAFFYCNSVSFMLSIALIILLVNPNLYRPAIRSHALSVCTAAGMLSLVGAYAAGSTQHQKTSIYIFALVVAILIIVVAVVLIFAKLSRREAGAVNLIIALVRYIAKLKRCEAQAAQEKPPQDGNGDIENGSAADHSTEEHEALKKQTQDGSNAGINNGSETEDRRQKKLHSEFHKKRKYVMLLGILVASVTYQAGLKPPGGMWQRDGVGHTAGNPVMYGNRRQRYQAFFYINAISFVASIIVIILLLVDSLLEKPEEEKQEQGKEKQEQGKEEEEEDMDEKDKEKEEEKPWWAWTAWRLRAINTTVALDLLGLLLAYAVGSGRSWKTSGIVLALVIPVLFYIGIHVLVSRLIRRHKNNADRNVESE